MSSALELLDGALEEAGLPRSRLASVGVTVPGMVDTRSGTVAFAPNLGWSDVPIRSLLQQALELPVVVHNVTNRPATRDPANVPKHASRSVSRSFTPAATFSYQSSNHPGMTGQVVVQ